LRSSNRRVSPTEAGQTLSTLCHFIANNEKTFRSTGTLKRTHLRADPLCKIRHWKMNRLHSTRTPTASRWLTPSRVEDTFQRFVALQRNQMC
jgi:hypothetical protein